MKLSTFNFQLSTLLAATMLTACHPEADIETAPTPIPFNITIEGHNTRVTTDAAFKSTFETGDAIGLYVVKYSGGIATLLSSGNYVDNAKLTYNGTSWSGDVYYAPVSDTNPYAFYAYYPYNPNLTDAGDIPVDAVNNPADHLTASQTGVARGETVSLSFEHILTLVQVDFDATQCYISPTLAVTLQGCKPTGTYGLNGIASPTGDIAPIPMTRMGTTNTFRAMVPPQTIAAGTHMFLIENDDLFQSQPLAGNLTLNRRQAEVFSQKINGDYAPLITDDNFRAYCITTFDTNKDGKLSEAEIMAVKTIDVYNKGITTLAGIEHFKSLQTLSCSYNQLTKLNLSALTALQYLDCSNNQLTELNLSALTALQYLYCHNNQLTELNLSTLTALQSLWCHNNSFNELDVTANAALQILYCGGSNPCTVWVQSTTTLGIGAGLLNVQAAYNVDNYATYTPITQKDTPVDGVTVRDKP